MTNSPRYALHVRGELHGAGHGTRLLAATVSVVRGWGCRRLQFFVATANTTARAFYTHRGWADDGFRRSPGAEGTATTSPVRSGSCAHQPVTEHKEG
jgi:hypothetical protein